MHYMLMSLGILAIANTVSAQDSLIADKMNYQRERSSLLNGLRFQGTTHAALRQYRFQTSGTDVEASYGHTEQDSYNLQRGSGNQGLTIATQSYLRDIFEKTTVWGHAEYTASTLKDVRYNESLEYDRIFPYFIADSVGGDLKMERYRFGGGLVRSIGQWNIGGELNIDAKQNYRNSDPRPNNTSTILGLNISVSRPINDDYLLSLSVGGHLFKERNSLNFVGKIGNPLITNLNGLGAYNRLLTQASSADADFTTNKIDASVQIMPRSKGLWLSIGGTTENGEKVTSRAFDPINNWEEQNAKIVVGYDGQWNALGYVATLGWTTQRRKGDEGLYTATSSQEFPVAQISRTSSYRYYLDNYSASITIGANRWNARLNGNYAKMLEQYASPFRTQEVEQFHTGIDLQYFQPLGDNSLQVTLNTTKTITVNSAHKFTGVSANSGVWDLLNNNFAYLTREPLYIQPAVRWSLPTFNRIAPYIAAHTYYATDINQKGWEMKIGLIF